MLEFYHRRLLLVLQVKKSAGGLTCIFCRDNCLPGISQQILLIRGVSSNSFQQGSNKDGGLFLEGACALLLQNFSDFSSRCTQGTRLPRRTCSTAIPSAPRVWLPKHRGTTAMRRGMVQLCLYSVSLPSTLAHEHDILYTTNSRVEPQPDNQQVS